MATIAVTFKHVDEVDGEPIGPVYVYEENEKEPSWTGQVRTEDGGWGAWMTLSQARAWAEVRGYKFYG